MTKKSGCSKEEQPLYEIVKLIPQNKSILIIINEILSKFEYFFEILLLAMSQKQFYMIFKDNYLYLLYIRYHSLEDVKSLNLFWCLSINFY